MNKPSDYGVPHPSWRPQQLESVEWALGVDDVGVLEAATGCHRSGQLILMHDGTCKKVELVRVGDKVMGPDSLARRVCSLCTGHGQMFRISPVKGAPFVVNENHILTLVRTGRQSKNETVDVSVADYLFWSRTQKHLYKLFRVGVEFEQESQGLRLDPYFLGVLLGDGYLGGPQISITTKEPEIAEEIYNQARKYQIYVRQRRKPNNQATTYYFRMPHKGYHERTAVANFLGYLGLLGHTAGSKFIPPNYKVASVKQRLELLAGLMDTDGHLSKGSYFDYISKSPQLASDVAFVARSVGLAAYVRPCRKACQTGASGIYHRVSISGEASRVPCRVPNKIAQPRKQKKSVLRTGLTVERLGFEPFYGFVLDGDGRYLLGDFTVTHNSGKSAIAKAVSSKHSTIAVVRTKALQAQYGGKYGAAILTGMDNYLCVHPDAAPGATCGECLHSSKGMRNCPHSSSCEYLLAKSRARRASFASLNYSYIMLSKEFRESAAVYFLDEAHNLDGVVLDFVGLKVNERRRRDWSLPAFPKITGMASGSLDAVSTPTGDALEWLVGARNVLALQYRHLQAAADAGEQARKRARRCERFGSSVRATIDALNHCSDDWFVRSGDGVLYSNGESVPGFIARPLTAKYHFPRYFLNGNATVAMSATIGDPGTFAKELGIKDYVPRSVPSRWPPEARRVYLLDAPRMGRGSSHLDYETQADVVADAIKTCPPDWSGILHVTRKSEAPLVAHRLAKRGLQGRMWVPPQGPTEGQITAWERRKARHPGSLMVGWTFQEGFDGISERICGTVKVPFGNLGDPYTKARFDYSHSGYLLRAAQKLMQSCGRTRRGREEDYDVGERRGLVFIADANWTRVQNYLSESFKEGLVEW